MRFPTARSTHFAWGEIRIATPGRIKLPINPRPLRNRGLARGFPHRIGRLLEAERVKPAYSHDAYQVDRKGGKRCLWRYTPGIALEFIHHLPNLLAKKRKPLVLYCRVSSEKQEESGNLDDQVNGAIRELQGMGFKVGYDLFVFQHVGSSSIHAYRTELERAIEEARKRDGIVVAMHRDRLIRSGSFDGRTETEAPTIYEYMQLRRMAGDIPLATIRHPDQPARSDQIKRGQTAKGRKGGRPLKRKWKERRLARIDIAREMRHDGKSYQQIAATLNGRDDGFCDVTGMGVWYWLNPRKSFPVHDDE